MNVLAVSIFRIAAHGGSESNEHEWRSYMLQFSSIRSLLACCIIVKLLSRATRDLDLRRRLLSDVAPNHFRLLYVSQRSVCPCSLNSGTRGKEMEWIAVSSFAVMTLVIKNYDYVLAVSIFSTMFAIVSPLTIFSNDWRVIPLEKIIFQMTECI